MQTTNIISTPEITGNIGSCSSNVINVLESRNGYWTENWRNITTNSCTGQVTYGQEYWQITGLGDVTIGFFILISIIVFSIVILKI